MIKRLSIILFALIGAYSIASGQTVVNAKGELVATVSNSNEVVTSTGYVYMKVEQDSLIYAYDGVFWGKLVNTDTNQKTVYKGDREYIMAHVYDYGENGGVLRNDKDEDAIGFYDGSDSISVYNDNHDLLYTVVGLKPELAAILGVLIMQ